MNGLKYYCLISDHVVVLMLEVSITMLSVTLTQEPAFVRNLWRDRTVIGMYSEVFPLIYMLKQCHNSAPDKKG